MGWAVINLHNLPIPIDPQSSYFGIDTSYMVEKWEIDSFFLASRSGVSEMRLREILGQGEPPTNDEGTAILEALSDMIGDKMDQLYW